MRIWRWLTSQKQLGQAHGIDSIISHWRKGSLVVHCPACSEPNFNMEPGWENTLDKLRYDDDKSFLNYD